MKGIGLYGNGMHDFVLREAEVGYRVAAAEDSEDCGFDALFDLQFYLYMRAHTCVVCDGEIQWIDCPTGGWWAHGVHPADNHDAVSWSDDATAA